MKEASPAVESYQEGAAEGCDHSGSHGCSRRCVVRGMLGGGGLGKQVVQGPCWTDPLCSQANSVVPYHPWEAQHHHLPEGDPDVLHSISRVVSPWHWQILGPRTQKRTLEG